MFVFEQRTLHFFELSWAASSSSWRLQIKEPCNEAIKNIYLKGLCAQYACVLAHKNNHCGAKGGASARYIREENMK